MFDSPMDFFAFAIAIAALIFANKAFSQVAALRARLDALERSPAAAITAGPPPLPAQEAPIAPAAAADYVRIEPRRRLAVDSTRAGAAANRGHAFAAAASASPTRL
jgi:hypothetical protein